MKYRDLKPAFEYKHEPKKIKDIFDTIPSKFVRDYLIRLFNSKSWLEFSEESLDAVISGYISWSSQGRRQFNFLSTLSKQLRSENVNWIETEKKLRDILLKDKKLPISF